MKCDEVSSLRDAYLDSELDAKTTIELEQHLKSCPPCGRAYAEAQRFETLMKAGLNQGPRTAALWAQIERSVLAAAPASTHPRPSRTVSHPGRWYEALLALGQRLQAGWRASPRVWAGLAAVWGVVLVLHFSAREAETPLVAQRAVPSAAELRFALKQKQLLMTELAVASGPASASRVTATPPGPRSDRSSETLNT